MGLYYRYKVYLLDSLVSGHFPLWSPSEGAGYPFYSNPFTQAFYPLNLFLMVFYKLKHGYSPYHHQVYAVLGVSIFSVGLFLWLRLIVRHNRACLFTVLLISASYKLGEILRFPNAIHTAAWMPWILLGVTLAADRRHAAKGGIMVYIASLCLLTGGYPYYIYYSIFLLPPYVLLLMFPGTRIIFLKKTNAYFSMRNFFTAIMISASLALLSTSFYLIKLFQLLSQTHDRTGGVLEFSLSGAFTPVGILGALLFPPASSSEGWFYFSCIGVFLILFYVFYTFLQKPALSTEKRWILVGGLWIGFVFCITCGRHSYLFHFLWRYLPGFSGLREWGRLHIILLPLLALFLARAFRSFEKRVTGKAPSPAMGEKRFMWCFFWLCLVLLSVQVALDAMNIRDTSWQAHFKHLHQYAFLYIPMGSISILSLILVLGRSIRTPLQSGLAMNLMTGLCVLIAIIDLYPVGSQQWTTNSTSTEKRYLRLTSYFPRIFTYPRVRVIGTLLFAKDAKHGYLSLPHNVGWVASWYYDRFIAFDETVFAGEDKIANYEALPYYTLLMGLSKSGRRIFLSKRIDHDSIQGFIEDALQVENAVANESSLVLKYYDGDHLWLSVNTRQRVYLSFIDNWDPDWQVRVDGREAPLEKLWGTFKSVAIEAGAHDVHFIYQPRLYREGGIPLNRSSRHGKSK